LDRTASYESFAPLKKKKAGANEALAFSLRLYESSRMPKIILSNPRSALGERQTTIFIAASSCMPYSIKFR